jgi:hypothetical protein
MAGLFRLVAAGVGGDGGEGEDAGREASWRRPAGAARTRAGRDQQPAVSAKVAGSAPFCSRVRAMNPVPVESASSSMISAASRLRRSSTLQERQIECREYHDDPDVYQQPRPEEVPQEQDVHADHYGYQGEHVKHDGRLSSHQLVLLRAAERSKRGAGARRLERVMHCRFD